MKEYREMSVDDRSLLERVQRAFACIPRPSSFVVCNCDECQDLDAKLQGRDFGTLQDNDFISQLCLLSPSAITYWTPALVRMCLECEPGFESDTREQFIQSELGQALPQVNPPKSHPRFGELNASQTAAIVEFLLYIQHRWYIEEAINTPRRVVRAIRNWSRMAGTS